MQSVSSRIWTRVAVSISYDDNHYTTGTALLNTQQYKVCIKGKMPQSLNGVAPSHIPRCSSYWKGSLLVTLDYGRQLYFIYYIYTYSNFSWNVSLKIKNGYRRRKWTRRHEFKSWTRLIAFHIALIPLGKVWIQLFSPPAMGK